jgi:putative PEP-CTERM system histidine kinase
MHDLKNLMSQLSLVVKNAEKHRNNPAFVDDAISTVDNSVKRMNRLLAQLKTGAVSSPEVRPIDIQLVLNNVQSDKKHVKPVPVVEVKQNSLIVCADFHRFVSVVGHVVQNAQDATPADGFVKIIADRDEEFAFIKVIDNGSGMDSLFIKERLFKPFDSTKGLSGMGIGAHDVKQFVEGLGGSVDVTSQVGKGTTFVLKIPLCV